MKIPLLFALLAGSVVSQYAFADVCKNVNGVPSSINYDLTTTLTAEQNRWERRFNWKKARGS